MVKTLHRYFLLFLFFSFEVSSVNFSILAAVRGAVHRLPDSCTRDNPLLPNAVVSSSPAASCFHDSKISKRPRSRA